MDPNVTLDELRHAFEMGDAATNADDARLWYGDASEFFSALDEWLSKGGFLPARWERR